MRTRAYRFGRSPGFGSEPTELDPLDGEDLLLRIRELSFLDRSTRRAALSRPSTMSCAPGLRERLGPDRLRILGERLAQAITDRANADWKRFILEPYALAHLPMHVAGAGDTNALEGLLCDGGWIAARLSAGIAAGESRPGCCGPAASSVASEKSRGACNNSWPSLTMTSRRTDRISPFRQLLGGVQADEETEPALAAWRPAPARSGACPDAAKPGAGFSGALAPATRERCRKCRLQSVAFSPDGTRLATGSRTRRRGSGTSRPARRSPGSRAMRTRSASVAFSPDGTRLATGSVTGRRGSGTSRPGRRPPGSRAMRPVTASPSPRTGRASPPGPMTGRRGSGTWRRAWRSRQFRFPFAVAQVAISPDGSTISVAAGPDVPHLDP